MTNEAAVAFVHDQLKVRKQYITDDDDNNNHYYYNYKSLRNIAICIKRRTVSTVCLLPESHTQAAVPFEIVAENMLDYCLNKGSKVCVCVCVCVCVDSLLGYLQKYSLKN